MPGYIIVGMQWGDEGKGKTVDFLTKKADVVVRYQGGNNAGHTVVVNEQETVLHLVPCGILHPECTCIIGNGTVIDPKVLIQELDDLASANCEVDGRLYISEAAHVIMPYHKALDSAQENFRGKNKIGTTNRGIGPCYADKADRFGIRFGDLIEPDIFQEKLKSVLEFKNNLLEKAFGQEPLDYQAIIDEYTIYADRLRRYAADTVLMVNEAQEADKNIVFEGAQGAMLDIDHGTFPYVTSSTTMAGGVYSGAGIAPNSIKGVIGIVKAYTTRVGEGPMPSELLDETGETLRKAGHEFGATTGRPRRCGWLDMVQLRRAVKICGVTGFVLTKADVLGIFDTIKICTSYDVDGTITDEFPTRLAHLDAAKPICEEHPGWKEDISGCESWESLPENARKYIERIEELSGVPVSILSVGPGREQTIARENPF
jgi:adenylosuccinate synthase